MHDYPFRQVDCWETTKELLQVLKEIFDTENVLVIYLRFITYYRIVLFQTAVYLIHALCMKKPICQHTHDFVQADITVGLDQKIHWSIHN